MSNDEEIYEETKAFSAIRGMSVLSRAELVVWLKGREGDIAQSIEDFGKLRKVFIELFGREPKE